MATDTRVKIVLAVLSVVMVSSGIFGIIRYLRPAVEFRDAFLLQPKIDNVDVSDIQYVIKQLNAKISKSQNKQGHSGIPPISWRRDKGLYGSEVRLNFHGTPEVASVREGFHVYDNNMFATAWITICLLEASLYGTGPLPATDDIDLAVNAVDKYVDKNINGTTSLMTFWPQLFNESAKTWQSTPQNLLSLFDLVDNAPIKLIEYLLNIFGMKEIEHIMEHLINDKAMFAKAFHIPADFDDTFVNIGLGSLLQLAAPNFSSAWHAWEKGNSDLSSVFMAVKKYAYRPFADGHRMNTIDPRTYFYLHSFLNENHHSDIALVPTWVQNPQEAMAKEKAGVSMPFFINNVDVTVAANTIFGITASILQGLVPSDAFDEEIQQIYLNTSSLIAYQLSSNFSSRRDLALTYYPSKFECYWFTSRTLALLKRRPKDVAKHPVMAQVREILNTALDGPVTRDIFLSMQHEGNMTYFDDFLGDGDFTYDNRTERRAEDRLFTTAMAANTLIDVWTIFDSETKHLIWRQDVPSIVQTTLRDSISWLSSNALSGTYKPWNAFFSGSGKGIESMPFWFPANRLEFANGTRVNSTTIPNELFLIGFQGYVNEDVYANMVKQPHFGMKTPIDFHGYNNPATPEGFFPFWSSSAYTYSTIMLALSKYNNIS